MNQIINIFRKDLRHLRLELVVSWAILLLYTIVVPRSWAESFYSPRPAAQLTSMLNMALDLSWALLILRLVHGERLAGVNQFWTTRPYEWPKLLAAKAIFLMLFMYVPLLLSQVYLLHAGGTGIAPNISILLLNLIRLTALLVLPMLCIAAVTGSFAQTTLSLLGIAVGITAFVTALQYAGSISATLGVPRTTPSFLAWLELGLAGAFSLFALLLQYRRRATRRAIAILGIAAVVLVVAQQTLQGSSAAAAGYAPAQSGQALSVTVRQRTDPSVRLFLPRNPRTAVYSIPLTVSYSDPAAIFLRDAHRYTLTAADGYTWTSNWINEGAIFLPENAATNQRPRSIIDIPWRVHDRLIGGPVSIRMEFLVAQMQESDPYTSQISTEDQPVPGLGSCALDHDWRMVACRVVTGRPDSYFNVHGFGSRAPCPGAPDSSPDSDSAPAPSAPTELIPVSGSVGRENLLLDPFPFISPVSVLPMFLRPQGHPETTIHLCPGQPLAFTRESVLRRFQVQTPAATIVLKDDAGPGR
jgi:uncharacterized membrane protein YidH (DUF202 family)